MEQEQDKAATPSRWGFLSGAAGVGVGFGAAGCVGLLGLSVADGAQAASQPDRDVAETLNLAATAESLSVTIYHAVLSTAAFHMDAVASETLAQVLEADTSHLRTLQELGGIATSGRFYLPSRLRSDASAFVRTASTVETALLEIYLALTPQVARLGRPEVAGTMARLAAGAAQHLTLINHLAGLRPIELTGPTREQDAAALLTPFLRGGAGLDGPVSFPANLHQRVTIASGR